MGDKKRKLLLTLLLVGVLGSVAAYGTYSAFTATTTNSGNSFAAGTVAIQDDSGLGTALINLSNQAPNASVAKCIRIKYLGSLASTVHFYIPSTTNGTSFQLQVERGSGLTAGDLSTRACSGFSASSTAFATADLSTFPSAFSPSGVAGKASDAAWAQNDTVDYRFTFTVKDDTTANAHTSAVSTGSFAITWEAQSN
jgi:predicted ribosomally synthesized peptide with SipW-like signal peptide